eukprot:Ihof_evm2s169 gene=Ihof_evmTU2s169
MSTDIEVTRPLRNKPKGSDYTQQNLPVWQPILTPQTVIVTLLLIGVFALPFGGALVAVSNRVREHTIKYTDCKPLETETTCATSLTANISAACKCTITFTLDENWPGPVFMYYSLSNYYQNYRRYVESRSARQLNGESGTQDCGVLSTINNQPIAPCGFIANSLFNDTFRILNAGLSVELSSENIAWEGYVNNKFKNPPSFDGTVKPPYWSHAVTEFSTGAGQGYINEDLVVWMQPAPLPRFRKLYRIIPAGLPAGTYNLEVDYNYPVTQFRGQKSIVLSTMSFMGGRNSLLGPAYILVGLLSLLLALCFTVRVILVP